MTSDSRTSQVKPRFSGNRNPLCRQHHCLAALACALTLVQPIASMAATDGREVVTYADLDLGYRTGARELSERVLAAARRACRSSRLGSGIDQSMLYRSCVTDTYREAMERFGSTHPSGAFVLQVRRTPYRASLSPRTDSRLPQLSSRR